MDRTRSSVAVRLERERADLARAESDIAEGQLRVTEQELRVEQLRHDRRDTALAEALLANLRATLAEWHIHRDLILSAIRRLQAEPP